MATKISLNEDEQRLRDLLLDVSSYIGAETKDGGPQIRFAGGWVRDKLLGIGSQDIDIAVDNMTGLRFAEYMREFATNSQHAAKYGEDIVKKITKIAARPEQSKHLETATLTVFGLSIDIANLRKEVYDDVSRNPQMEFGTAEEDALRRDATINALFYNVQDEVVEDLTKRGFEDMEKKIIRTPLDAFQTFKDDPLRILRCIRFASRLGYHIEESAVKTMAIPEIGEALRLKITRERIGVEMEKIFKGPRVLQALQYIEEAKLYPIVFSSPAWSQVRSVSLDGWCSAYQKTSELIATNEESNTMLGDLKRWLAISKEDYPLVWMIAALVPYSSTIHQKEHVPNKKDPKTLPALVAREGLKVDNKIRDMLDAAFSRLHVVTNLKETLWDELHPSTSCKENRKRIAPITREEVGMTLNDWGISWRASVVAAMISELMANNNRDLDLIVEQYHNLMKWIAQQSLLDAHNLKPLVDGRELLLAVNKTAGPWTKQAVRKLLEWQFKNPDATDASDGIKEVVSQFKD